jgi:hypothetical protein
MRAFRPLVHATAALALAACGEPLPPSSDAATDALADTTDGGIDAPPPPMCNEEFTLETGSATGHAEPLGANAMQARAGRLTAAQLPADRTGLATWAEGDYVLANDRIAAIIEAARPSALYDPWGGKLVGLARVQGGRLVDAADFNEAIFGIGRHTVETTSVTVLHDGSDGGPAVVRAIGNLRPIPFIDEFARAIAPANYRDIRVAIDYELRPGAEHIDVRTTFEHRRATNSTINLVLHAFFQRYRMGLFHPGSGFSPAMGAAPVPYVGYVDDSGMSYAWSSPDGMLSPFLTVSGFDAYTSPGFTLPACSLTPRHFARIVVGGPGLDGLVQAVARTRNERLREIQGMVLDANRRPAAGVRVHATSLDGATYYTRATSDASGMFVLHVPEGQAVQLRGWRNGDAVAGPVNVAANELTALVQLAAAGTIHVTATEDGTGAQLPVRIQVLPIGGTAPSVPMGFGEQLAGDRVHIVFPTNGVADLRVPVGQYRVVVSRGFEYELFTSDVMVQASETVNVRASLRRVVDTAGVQCGDFHIHTHRSPDADDTARFKLASAAGDGLEIPVRSDHEWVADFEPLIQEMGLGRWMHGVPSLELTTFTWGHFGVVPLQPEPARPNAGTFDWPGRLPPDVFSEVRRRASAPTIIINHPRSGGRAGGYFDAAGFDPATGRATRPEYWDNDFTAVEVFNDSDFESNRMTTVRDWFSLLSHGRRVFAVGSSDSHHILAGSPVGYPRTCMFLGTDDPRGVTPEAVRDAAARGRSTISGGVYVTAVGPNDTGPGQEATSVGARATVRVTVQAPSWIHPERLEVIVDGMTTQTIPLDASTADPGNPVVRFRRDIEIPVAEAGSYVLFVAHSTQDLAPVHPGRRAFGVTNPIFLRR